MPSGSSPVVVRAMAQPEDSPLSFLFDAVEVVLFDGAPPVADEGTFPVVAVVVLVDGAVPPVPIPPVDGVAPPLSARPSSLASMLQTTPLFPQAPAGIPIPAIAGLVIMILSFYMTRRTREGAELYAKYKALHDFLKDFSRLDEAPPASVVIWNRFLVLAVVFGIADEVIE